MTNEKRLIDANKAFEMITDFAGQADTKSAYAAFWKAGRAIQNMNTVDAVEVVRCKDCKWRNTKGCPYMNFNASARGDFDFCSDGERKDNEQT